MQKLPSDIERAGYLNRMITGTGIFYVAHGNDITEQANSIQDYIPRELCNQIGKVGTWIATCGDEHMLGNSSLGTTWILFSKKTLQEMDAVNKKFDYLPASLN